MTASLKFHVSKKNRFIPNLGSPHLLGIYLFSKILEIFGNSFFAIYTVAPAHPVLNSQKA